VWTDAADDDAAKAVLSRSENARTAFVALLGNERVGDRRIRVRLLGEGSAREIPTVDLKSGDILLYRFPGAGGAYDAPVAHELVHALRVSRWANAEQQTDAALFWDEGFAELLAREAGFASTGFPLFGTDADVAAASFVTRNEWLPVTKLFSEHRALNFRCMAQAYVERVSFMAYLRARVGLAPIIAIAYASVPLDLQTVEKTLGVKLADVAEAHRLSISKTAAQANTRDAGTTYRETTPIRYLPVCPRGAL
jgi:hypothetical protein